MMPKPIKINKEPNPIENIEKLITTKPIKAWRQESNLRQYNNHDKEKMEPSDTIS